MFVFVLYFLSTLTVYAADTTHVTILHKTVVTDPSKGEKQYDQWALFPSKNISIRKALLFVKVACPDSMRCADWDYSDRIIIKRKGSEVLNYTIAQLLTPYGGAFSKSWNFQWQVDITDFMMLLRDSVEISYVHSGYEENKDRGWKILLDFAFIKGAPVANPLAVHKVYHGNYQYGNASHSIEEQLKPYVFVPNDKTRQARIYVLQTGHGMDSAGCGEFCSKYREIWWNNSLISKKDLWMKCGDNPLYPQAGTWIFDRANWCPGYLNQPEILEVPVAQKKQNVFDIQMENYVSKDPNVAENIFAYVIEYGAAHRKYDIAIEDVLVPSTTQIYSRKNPSCQNPVILIRNNGSEKLKSCTIRFGTKGFPLQVYKWKGNLAFNELAEVQLPFTIDARQGRNQFFVSLSRPNSKADLFSADNTMTKDFESAPIHGGKIIVQLKTNHKPGDNSYQLVDAGGKIVAERRLGSLKPDTLYQDTLLLTPGCYRFELLDTAGNGLEFWYATKAGRGTCRLLDERGRMLRNFESDFGNSVTYQFSVSADSSQWSRKNNGVAVGAFPTLTTGRVAVDFYSDSLQSPTVQIVSDGEGSKIVEEHQYHQIRQAVFDYDLSYRPPQRYYIKVYLQGVLVFNKRIRVVASVPD